jgi:hypothetical protein
VAVDIADWLELLRRDVLHNAEFQRFIRFRRHGEDNSAGCGARTT